MSVITIEDLGADTYLVDEDERVGGGLGLPEGFHTTKLSTRAKSPELGGEGWYNSETGEVEFYSGDASADNWSEEHWLTIGEALYNDPEARRAYARMVRRTLQAETEGRSPEAQAAIANTVIERLRSGSFTWPVLDERANRTRQRCLGEYILSETTLAKVLHELVPGFALPERKSTKATPKRTGRSARQGQAAGRKTDGRKTEGRTGGRKTDGRSTTCRTEGQSSHKPRREAPVSVATTETKPARRRGRGRRPQTQTSQTTVTVEATTPKAEATVNTTEQPTRRRRRRGGRGRNNATSTTTPTTATTQVSSEVKTTATPNSNPTRRRRSRKPSGQTTQQPQNSSQVRNPQPSGEQPTPRRRRRGGRGRSQQKPQAA